MASAMAGPPVAIPNSRSPDGRYSLVIVPTSDDDAAGTLSIRNTETQRLSGKFAWSSFGSRVTEDAVRAVLWSPDSRCFALYWPLVRGYMGSALYAHSAKGWVQLS